MRKEVWGLVYELIDNDMIDHAICYEGLKKWEDQIKDITDDIARIADEIEQDIIEKGQYSEDKDEEGCRKYHAKANGDK